jgi:hypothetical protein
MNILILKRIVLIVFISAILKFNTSGQDTPERSAKPIYITGITYDGKTLEPLSNANFRINNKSGFGTNESGCFSFYGFPGDTVVFTYIGYQPAKLIVPDTLRSEEYVMGVFMREQRVRLAEVIILRRIAPSSIVVTPVQTDQKTMNIAQNNVDKATIEAITRAPKFYDADMNARKTMRTNQMRIENKGMLVTPENAVGMSTQSYKTFSIIYGSPVIASGKVDKEIITPMEGGLLLEHFDAVKRLMAQPETAADTTVTR